MTLRGDIYADGAIVARSIAAGEIHAVHMAADSITATNGAIQNLAVKSFKIGDNAVTIPVAAALASIVGGNNGYQGVIGVNVGIDTTGLAGKTISVYFIFTGAQGTGGASSWGATITHGGSPIPGAGVSASSFQANFCTAGIYSYTATGGFDVITGVAQWFGQSGMVLQGGSLLAICVIR